MCMLSNFEGNGRHVAGHGAAGELVLSRGEPSHFQRCDALHCLDKSEEWIYIFDGLVVFLGIEQGTRHKHDS